MSECYCGGVAACLPCQERDAADARPMTLTDFLLARIAEDETERGEVHASHCGDLEYIRFYGWREGEPMNCDCGWPARVLAECEAKRRVLGEHEARWISPENWWACNSCGTPSEYDVMSPCPTLRLLALPYADHEDFQEEWRGG